MGRLFITFLFLLYACANYGSAIANQNNANLAGLDDYEIGDSIKLGSLPTLFINTVNHEAITSKEEYVEADYWVEDLLGGANLGSKDAPLKLSIKGRGNATWRSFEKKPYRLKLSNKQNLVGLKKNKHFVLLTLVDDNGMGFMKYPVAMELSKRIGLGWTPDYRFVELILNGDYRGLYLLIEKIRIDKDRIDIEEQADGEEDDEKITGGWLLEIDNYKDPQQLEFEEGNGQTLRVTYHSPDSLSDKQNKYLTQLIEKCNQSIYCLDKTNNEWEDNIDIYSVAQYYIVNEILHNPESFMGSCYFYKDRGMNKKLKFGPLWDLGAWVYNSPNMKEFFYENPPYEDIHWIQEIAKFSHFQEVVREIWAKFKNNLNLTLLEDSVEILLHQAAENNYKRWPSANWTGKLSDGREYFDIMKDEKIRFLNEVWDLPSSLKEVESMRDIHSDVLYSLSGIRVYSMNPIKICISKSKKKVYNRGKRH